MYIYLYDEYLLLYHARRCSVKQYWWGHFRL